MWYRRHMIVTTVLSPEQITDILRRLTFDGVVLPGYRRSNPDYWDYLFEGKVHVDNFAIRRITGNKHLFPFISGTYRLTPGGTEVLLRSDFRLHFIQVRWIVASVAVPIYLFSILGLVLKWFVIDNAWNLFWILLSFASPFLFIISVRFQSQRRLQWMKRMLHRVLIPDHATQSGWIQKLLNKRVDLWSTDL
jgi:hypothetical protein